MNTDIYRHNNITVKSYHELYISLYDSVAKQIKQQTANRWFAGSKPGRGFKSPINWNPFQVEFLSLLTAKKSRNHLKSK